MNDDKPNVSLEDPLSRDQFLKGAAATGAVVMGTLYGTSRALAAGGRIANVSKKKYRIAIVPKGLNVPVFVLAKLGMEQRAKELGNVETIFTAAPTIETPGNIAILENLIASGVDGIGISCNDPVAYIPVINKAVSKGIKVMTWDSDAPKSKRSTFYGVDSFQAGKHMAGSMNQLLGGKGNIVLISGNPSSLNLNLRVQGAKATLAPGIKVLATLHHDESLPGAVSVTENAIRSYSNLDGILAVGGWAFFTNQGTMPELAKRKGQIKVVTFDVLGPTVDWLKAGLVQAVWTQDYWGWGYQSTTILYGLLTGRQWNTVIPQTSVEVRKTDVKLWAARWAATSKGLAQAAKVWREAPLKPPGH